MARQIDLNKVKFSGRYISTQDAVKDIEPLPINEEVLQGQRELVVSSPRKRKDEEDEYDIHGQD